MNTLRELIGKKVIAVMYDDIKETDVEIDVKVIDVVINDFYFNDKGEQIYIELSLMPLESYSEGINEEDFHALPLSQIRRSYN